MSTLTVHPTNPRYFSAGGAPILMTGSHNWFNVHDEAGAQVNFTDYLTFLVAQGHNFIRAWQVDEPVFDVINVSDIAPAPMPWARTGPGNAADGGLKFDLSVFDQDYFDQLLARATAAQAQGIYFSAMLFDGWWRTGNPSSFSTNQHNSSNNINGCCASATDVYTLNNSTWVALMDDYLRKVVDTLNGLDNVLYEVANECPLASADWQYHMVDLFHSYEATKAKQHPVGMTALIGAGVTTNAAIRASNADWISPWEITSTDEDYGTAPKAADGNFVYLLDTDHIGVINPASGNDAHWVWRSFLRGHNPIYMDPLEQVYTDYEADLTLRAAMGHVREVAAMINLGAMVPADATASTGYCLADTTGREYLVYQPSNASFTVNLPAETFRYRWVNPANGALLGAGEFTATAGDRTFNLPAGVTSGVIHLRKRQRSVTAGNVTAGTMTVGGGA